jgi:hypothetical protein
LYNQNLYNQNLYNMGEGKRSVMWGDFLRVVPGVGMEGKSSCTRPDNRGRLSPHDLSEMAAALTPGRGLVVFSSSF